MYQKKTSTISNNLVKENIIKILMLEDTPSDSEFIVRELQKKRLNYSAQLAETKNEFIRYINDFQPDLILSDYKLPTINGLDALHIAREIYPDIPFIIVTGSQNEEIAVECMKAGADDYILKENLTRLVPAIKSAIKNNEIKIEKDIALNELIESEQRFHTLADNMFPLAWIADGEGWILWYNKRWYDFTGTTLEEMQKKGWVKVVHPDQIDRVIKGMKHSWDNGIIWEDTIMLRGKTGDYRWFISRALPIRNDKGEIIQWFGTNSDVTKQKLLEEELSTSASRFKRMFESNIMGVVIGDFHGNILEANDYYLELLGYSRKEFEQFGIRWEEHTPQEYISLDNKAIEELKTNGVSNPYEKEYITKPGEKKWVMIANTIFPAADPQILAFVIDITEKKKTEEERERLLKEFERQQSWLNTIIEQMPSGLSIADAASAGKFITYNNQAVKLLRHPMMPSANREFRKYGALHSPDKTYEPEEYPIARALKGETVYGEEMLYRRGDGTLTYISVNATPVKDQEGKIIAAISTFDDISKEKSMHESLLQSEEKFRRVVEHIHDALMINDFDGKIIFANDRFLKLFGFKTKNVSEIKLDDYVAPEYCEGLRERHNLCMKGNIVPTHFEYQGLKRDGSRIWVEEDVVTLYDKNGMINGTQSVIRDITERKQWEETLQKRERDYKSLAENLPDFMVRLDKQLRYTYVNSTAANLIGKPKESIIGKSIFEMGLPEDFVAFLSEKLYGIFETSEIQKFDFTYNNSRGLTVFEALHVPELGPDGEIESILAVNRDITERKTAEKEREAQQIFLQAILDQLPVGVSISDGKTGIGLFHNNEAVRLLGHPLIEGDNYVRYENYHAVHKDGKPYNAEEYPTTRAVLFGEVIHEEEMHYLRGEKSKILLSVSSTPVIDGEGKKIAVVTIFYDISERKRAEEALRESEEKLLEAQDLAHLGSYTIDIDTGKAEWSDEMFRIFEIQKSSNELTLEEIFQKTHPDDLGRVKALFEEVIADKESAEYEFRIITPGKIKYLYAKGKTIEDSFGRVIKVFGTVMDITERKMTQLKLEETLYELQRSNKDLEQFAYTASHDLQEPIRMIKSYSELLDKRYKNRLDGNGVEFLSFISEGASRMQNLVSDLLKYSRITTKGQPFVKVDSSTILKEVLDDLKFKIQEEKAVINYEELPVVFGDNTQLRQVFQNLIQNALKFRTERDPLIEINCEKKNKTWLFSVKDNGIGIEEEYLERIFVIFQRLHEREKYPGTGIGLAIVKKIIERHGGSVCVESEKGKGSIFYFSLPAG